MTDELKFNNIKLVYTKNDCGRWRSVSLYPVHYEVPIFYDIIITIKIIYVTIISYTTQHALIFKEKIAFKNIIVCI